jgi:hypothetical protein
MQGVTVVLSFIVLLLAGCSSSPPPRMAPVQASPVAGQASAPPSVAWAPAPRPRATGTPEDARRHMVRGTAAIEMAKSDAELAGAAEEFRIATEIDPTMAAAWFNLGAVLARMNQYDEAVSAYNEYLARAPNAEDAPRIRDEVIKLQYRQEQQAKTRSRAGSWISDEGALYQLTLHGERLHLKTTSRRVPESEVRSTYTMVGSVPNSQHERAEYQLALSGNRLRGIWTREAFQADKCTVPPESADAEGELDEPNSTMLLRHSRTLYRTATQMSVLANDYCGAVVALEKKIVEETLYGPLPTGGLGVVPIGLTQWWDGGFSAIQFGWQGRLAIGVAVDSAAYAAGLRDKDEILAIDGVPVSSLNAGQTMMRLAGQPGTPVALTLWRKGVPEPFVITMQRVAARQ